MRSPIVIWCGIALVVCPYFVLGQIPARLPDMLLASPTSSMNVLAPTNSDADHAVEHPSASDPTSMTDIHTDVHISHFNRYDALWAAIVIFVLSIFLGLELISKVPPTLHTPLMSGSNAISGITLVGAVIAAGAGSHRAGVWFGVGAVILATINVVGGFLVTHRMLAMFRRRP